MGAIRSRRIRELHSGEVFDFFSDNADSSLVGCVEFEDTGFDQFRAIKFFCQSKDSRCLSCSRRAVEEHVGELRGMSACIVECV